VVTPFLTHTAHTHITHSINQTVQYAKTNEIPGKYIHIKKEKQEKPVFSKRNATPPKAAFFNHISCTHPSLKKIEREKRHSSW
jgi:hypothetical protein